jgi:hypothetical protein
MDRLTSVAPGRAGPASHKLCASGLDQLLSARGPAIKQRHLPCQPTECALAEGHTENRRSSSENNARLGRPGEFCLPNRCFDFHAIRAYLLTWERRQGCLRSQAWQASENLVNAVLTMERK